MSEVGYDTDIEDAVHMSDAESSGSEAYNEPMEVEGRVRAVEIGFGDATYYEVCVRPILMSASSSFRSTLTNQPKVDLVVSGKEEMKEGW